MANPEHVRRLWRGANHWNRWRQENPHELPDLEGVYITSVELLNPEIEPGVPRDLTNFDLSGSNLRRANLTGVRLSGANLKRADLTEATLCFADLKQQRNFIFPNFTEPTKLVRANLTRANLRMACFDKANLMSANLQEADLWNASFKFANLEEANLTEATLTYANFWSANLQESTLSNTNVSEAELSFANLIEAKLCYANLSQAIFYGANLSQAIFYGADMTNANLSITQALGTDFTRALFTGACLENWNLNSATKVDDIDCRYVYLNSNNQTRIPSSRDFEPEEFSQLLQMKIEIEIATGEIQGLFLNQENIPRTREQLRIIKRFISRKNRRKVLNALRAGGAEMIKQIIDNPFVAVLISIIDRCIDK